MELLLASFVGVLTACGVYLLLRPRPFEVVLGLTLLSYAVNLFLFAMGRLRVNAEPILRGFPPDLAHHADPLPQALVLTAIVIGFAMTAVLLVLAIKVRADACAGGDAHADAGVEADADGARADEDANGRAGRGAGSEGQVTQ